MSVVDLPVTPRRNGALKLPPISPAGIVGLVIVATLVIFAVFADQIAPFLPTRMGVGTPLQPPSWAHPAGTDTFGRDMFSRIVHGARYTLVIGAIAVGISMSVGLMLGVVAAYARGWLEAILMRLSDVLFTFTDTLIALACVAVLGPSLENAMIAVGIAGIPLYARTAYAASVVERSSSTSRSTCVRRAVTCRSVAARDSALSCWAAVIRATPSRPRTASRSSR